MLRLEQAKNGILQLNGSELHCARLEQAKKGIILQLNGSE